MQRVKILRVARITGSERSIGDIIEVDDDLARHLVRTGEAEILNISEETKAILEPPKHTAILKPVAVKEIDWKDIIRPFDGRLALRKDFLLWIIVPTRNRAHSLQNVLCSIMLQANDLAKRLRIIIVNDGSDDYTQELLEGLKTDFPLALKTIQHTDQKGPGISRADAIALVPEEDVVIEIDDHDPLMPGALVSIFNAFTGGAYFVYGDCWRVPTNNTAKQYFDKTDYRPGLFRQQGSQALGCRAYRKSLYTAAGGYIADEFPAGDYALFLRMELAAGDKGFVRIPTALSCVTVDANGLSMQWPNEQTANSERFRNLAVEIASSVGQSLKPEGKRRVLFLCDYFDPAYGGGQTSLWKIREASDDAGFAVGILAERSAKTTREWLRPLSFFGTGQSAQDLERVVSEFGPDFIFASGSQLEHALELGNRLNIGVAYYFQFWLHLFKHRTFTLTEWDALDLFEYDKLPIDREGIENLKRVDILFANSEFTAKVLQDLTGREPIVIYPPIELSEIKAVMRKPEYIVMPSAQELKGGAIFLELARRFPEERFLIIASSWQRKWEDDFLERAGCLANVIIEDWQADIRKIYERAKVIFIGTQTCETFSRVAAEARANGIPILASNCGNLSNIVLAGGGLLIDKNAAVDVWEAGLRQLLAGEVKIESTERFCKNDSALIVEGAKESSRFHRVALVHGGGPGVETACYHLGKVLKMPVYRNAIPEGEWELVILAAGLDDQYRQFIERNGGKKKIALLWFSHLPQMAIDYHEIEQWLEALRMFKDGKISWLLTSGEYDGAVLSDCVSARYRALPLPFDLRSVPEIEYQTIPGLVSVVGPVHKRKNLFSALLAIKAAGKRARLSEWVGRDKLLMDFAKEIGLEFEVKNYPTKESYCQGISECESGINLSLAETLSYATLEHLLCGVPVVGSSSIPAMGAWPGGVCGSADIPMAVERLQYAGGRKRAELSKFARDEAIDFVKRQNAACRKTMEEILCG